MIYHYVYTYSHSWQKKYSKIKNHHHRHFIIVIFHHPAGWHWRPKPCLRAAGSALYILRLEIVMLIIILFHTTQRPEKAKLSGWQTLTRENFPDKVRKSFFIQLVHKHINFLCSFSFHPFLWRPWQNADAQSWLETSHTMGTISGLAKKNPNLSVPFESFWKFLIFSNNLETFETVWKIDRLSGNFQHCPKNEKENFKDYRGTFGTIHITVHETSRLPWNFSDFLEAF